VDHHETLDLTEPEVQNTLRWVEKHYHETLLRDERPLRYLERRGIRDRATLEMVRVGYADGSLLRHLPPAATKRGQQLRAHLRKIGLLNEHGRERLTSSIVIAAHDGAGNIVQLYGHTIAPRENETGDMLVPGPQPALFNRAALTSEEIILCRSPLDMVTLHATGYRNAVALTGTTDALYEALTESGVRRVYIATEEPDDDAASERIAERLLESGIESYRIPFAPRSEGSDKPVAEFRERLKRAHRYEPDGRAMKSTTDGLPDYERFRKKSDIPAEITADGDIVELVTADRYYRIEGFKKNMSPGKIQVSLTALHDDRSYTDRIEFHSGRERERFVKNTSDEFDLDARIVKSDVERVFLKLREIQEERIRERDERSERKIYVMPEDEKREALEWLKNTPDPLERMANEIAETGVLDEPINTRVSLLAAVSRNLDNPLGILYQAPSASGKSTLMNAILSVIPDESKYFFTDMSPQSLFYMEGDDALSHKTIAFAEEAGMAAVEYAMKTLLSDRLLSKASTMKDPETGNLVTRSFVKKGPVQLLLTTNRPHVTEDVLNRLLLLVLNNDPDLTRRIHELQRHARTRDGLVMKKRREKLVALHQNIHRLIRPLNVQNPYAELLTFPTEWNRTRRDHERYLTLIDAHALLNQHRRGVFRDEILGEEVECVRVTRDDIRAVNRLAVSIFGDSLDELGPVTRRLLETIEKMVNETCELKRIRRAECLFSRRELREYARLSESHVRDHLDRLSAFEYVVPLRGRQGQGFLYRLDFDGTGRDGERRFRGLIEPDSLPEEV